MPKNRQYYRKVKYPDKVTKPKRLVFVRIFLFRSAGIKIQYFPTVPFLFFYFMYTVFNPGKYTVCFLSPQFIKCKLRFNQMLI